MGHLTATMNKILRGEQQSDRERSSFSTDRTEFKSKGKAMATRETRFLSKLL
jgi:hypothetical protein